MWCLVEYLFIIIFFLLIGVCCRFSSVCSDLRLCSLLFLMD